MNSMPEILEVPQPKILPKGSRIAAFAVLYLVLTTFIYIGFVLYSPVLEYGILTLSGFLSIGLEFILFVVLLYVFSDIRTYLLKELLRMPSISVRTFAGLAAGLLIPALYSSFTQHELNVIDEMASKFDNINIVLHIAGLGLLIPLLEEAFFRGILQRWLASRYHGVIGLAASSLIFGVFHIDPIFGIVLGISWGIAYIISGSLAVSIIAHSLWNIFVA